jgi:hypothetical protein
MLDKRYKGILSGQIVFSTLNRGEGGGGGGGGVITEIERNIKSLIIFARDCRFKTLKKPKIQSKLPKKSSSEIWSGSVGVFSLKF